eukprot:g12888.t1
MQYADPLVHRDTLKMESFLERYASSTREELRQRAQAHYNTAMKYEAQFFDQALELCKSNPCAAERMLRADAPRPARLVEATGTVKPLGQELNLGLGVAFLVSVPFLFSALLQVRSRWGRSSSERLLGGF